MSSPTSTPGEQHVDPAGVLGLLDGLDAHPDIDPHGIIVHRHGHRIAEGYWAPHSAPDRPLVYSISKSFTSTALGLAIGDGLIGLDETVAELLPEESADASERARSIRVRHLASMSSGYDHEMLEDALRASPADPIRGLFGIEPEHDPGTWFAYNQPPFFALAVAIQRRVGARLVDYLRPRILEPLDVARASSQQWIDGHDLGFSGMHVTLDAVAELGQLHLDGGMRGDRRLLPEGCVEQATSRQVDNPRELNPDWRRGYCFGFWRARHGYRGDGAFGQFMIVLPEQDAVVAIFSETTDMQAVLDLVWEHLLPAVEKPASASDADLEERLELLATPTTAARTGGLPTPSIDGTFTRHGGQGQPKLTALELRGDELILTEAGEALELPLGREGWEQSATHPLAVSSAMAGDDLEIEIVTLETPHRLRVHVDPARQTFAADWVTAPLSGPRIGDTLAAMHAPV